VGVIKVRGASGGTFTLRCNGNQLSVSKGDDDKRDFWFLTDSTCVSALLDDAKGIHRIIPEHVAWHPQVEVPTDPRVIDRLRAINGSALIELTGVPGSCSRLWYAIGLGPKAIRYIDEQEPDVAMAIPYEVYCELRSSKRSLQHANSSGKLKVSGARALAMQLLMVSSMFMPADLGV
jgi:hypothetical protein